MVLVGCVGKNSQYPLCKTFIRHFSHCSPLPSTTQSLLVTTRPLYFLYLHYLQLLSVARLLFAHFTSMCDPIRHNLSAIYFLVRNTYHFLRYSSPLPTTCPYIRLLLLRYSTLYNSLSATLTTVLRYSSPLPTT